MGEPLSTLYFELTPLNPWGLLQKIILFLLSKQYSVVWTNKWISSWLSLLWARSLIIQPWVGILISISRNFQRNISIEKSSMEILHWCSQAYGLVSPEKPSRVSYWLTGVRRPGLDKHCYILLGSWLTPQTDQALEKLGGLHKQAHANTLSCVLSVKSSNHNDWLES